MKKHLTIWTLILVMAFTLNVPAFSYAQDEQPGEVNQNTQSEEPETTETTEGAGTEESGTVESTEDNENAENIITPITLPAVKNVKVTAVNYRTLKVSWKKASDITGYKIYMSVKAGSGFKLKKTITKAGTCSYTFTGLKTGQKKYFKVLAYKSGVNHTMDLNSATAGWGKPMLKKATGLKGAIRSTSSIKLTWKRVAGAHGYAIYQYSKSCKKYLRVKTVIGYRDTDYVFTKLKANKTRYYKIRAYRKVDGRRVYGTASNCLKIKTPRVLTQRTPGFSKTNAGKIIAKAKSKLGYAYSGGASGPNSFDCSGYVYWVIKYSGVKTKSVSRTSSQGLYSSLKKYNIGRNINNAQPGDIMLFSRSGSTSGIYHSALYYGDGKIIHASDYSTGVIVSKIAHRKVAAIIRLPNL